MNSSEPPDSTNGCEIAIIGMAGRFPGARTVDAFWHNLQQGLETISFFTSADLIDAGIDPVLLRNPNYVMARGVLDDIDLFDAAFFSILPEEATAMDPQHRVLLECAWEALENAGHDPEASQGLIGLYAGSGLNSYVTRVFANHKLMSTVSDVLATIMNEKDHLTTRVSYQLNLKGPSLTIQTFCSTSLVAIHLACQGLLSGSCDMALAGGVSISAQQRRGYLYQEGGIASPDGHCRAFDATARGTVGGSGVGIVVLRRLEDAVADGDNIYAIIKGSAINNDGSMRVGYTAPSVEGQARVIRDALAVAGTDPENISYVEAHGTGTPLGDPIEIAGLTQAFRSGTEEKGFCAIGSVKANVGHLDTAAGVAGVIKTVMMLKHCRLVPSLHFQHPNPGIDFVNSPFYVNSSLVEWTTDRLPRRAGVSSFGIGGTNAHLILEEFPDLAPRESRRINHLLVVSAKSSPALEKSCANLVEYLKKKPQSTLADVAYTLHVGRRAFQHRRIAICRSVKEAVMALESPDPSNVSYCAEESVPVAFMFAGQGAQAANMGRELYEFEPRFREQIDRCSEILKTHLGLDLRQVLFTEQREIEAAQARLNQTSLTQPALFAIEYALANLLMAWGVVPEAMIGHSIGEYVAACLAGVFSLEDALAVIATRGRLMQQLPEGAMVAVGLSEEAVQHYLGEQLSLAAVNSRGQCVVSGPTGEVEKLERWLTQCATPHHRLRTSHAFHSKMMSPIRPAFERYLRGVALQPPQIPFLSNVTGNWITATEATDPEYWARHLCRPVRLIDGLSEMLQGSYGALIEVGPGRSMSAFVKQHKDGHDKAVIPSMPHSTDDPPEMAFLLRAMGKVWLAGVSVDWSGLYGDERRRRIPLPSYPFEGKRYWVEAAENSWRQSVSGTKAPVDVNDTAARMPESPGTGAPIDPKQTIDPVELILAQQLEIISKQLAVLSDSVAPPRDANGERGTPT